MSAMAGELGAVGTDTGIYFNIFFFFFLRGEIVWNIGGRFMGGGMVLGTGYSLKI